MYVIFSAADIVEESYLALVAQESDPPQTAGFTTSPRSIEEPNQISHNRRPSPTTGATPTTSKPSIPSVVVDSIVGKKLKR